MKICPNCGHRNFKRADVRKPWKCESCKKQIAKADPKGGLPLISVTPDLSPTPKEET